MLHWEGNQLKRSLWMTKNSKQKTQNTKSRRRASYQLKEEARAAGKDIISLEKKIIKIFLDFKF